MAFQQGFLAFGRDEISDLSGKETFQPRQSLNFVNLSRNPFFERGVDGSKLFGLRSYFLIEMRQHPVLVHKGRDQKQHITGRKNAVMIVGVKCRNYDRQCDRTDQEGRVFSMFLAIGHQCKNRNGGKNPHDKSLQMRVDIDNRRQPDDRCHKTKGCLPETENKRDGGAYISEQAKSADRTLRFSKGVHWYGTK